MNSFRDPPCPRVSDKYVCRRYPDHTGPCAALPKAGDLVFDGLEPPIYPSNQEMIVYLLLKGWRALTGSYFEIPNDIDEQLEGFAYSTEQAYHLQYLLDKETSS